MSDTISPQDHVAVIYTIAEYAFRLDSGDLDGYVDCFAPDGVFDSTSGRFEGRQAIRDYVGKLLAARNPAPGGGMRHVMGMPSITGHGERCHAVTYATILAQAGDRIQVRMVGTYTDDIVKVDGRWRFAVRHIRMALTKSAG